MYVVDDAILTTNFKFKIAAIPCNNLH